MMWPFDPGWTITDDFNTPRGAGPHRAWDIAHTRGATIHAPQRGRVLLWYMVRAGDVPSAAFDWPSGQANPLSWYFADRYGACVILLTDDYWWLFAHCSVVQLFRSGFFKDVEMDYAKIAYPEGAVEVYANLRDMFVVNEGEMIGFIGNSGYSTGPHTHMEIMPPGYNGGAPTRIDPALVFSEQYEQVSG